MSRGLDINTPKGQESLAHERALIGLIESNYPDFKMIQTPKASASDVDGFLSRHGVIECVVENKCRDMSRDILRRSFRNEWLVTYDKLVRGAAMARALRVPFVGFLYMVQDRVALSVRIADECGNFMPPIRLERTVTQATTNGGAAVRTNAYISMADAKVVGA